LPNKANLETSDYTISGAGGLHFQELVTPATTGTTYNNLPAVGGVDVTIPSVTPGNSYAVASHECGAGQRISFKVSATGNLALNYFQDYNPSPIGAYISVCWMTKPRTSTSWWKTIFDSSSLTIISVGSSCDIDILWSRIMKSMTKVHYKFGSMNQDRTVQGFEAECVQQKWVCTFHGSFVWAKRLTDFSFLDITDVDMIKHF
jgi:hypothetical protein